MKHLALSLVLLATSIFTVPAIAADSSCDSPSRYRSGLNIQVEARDQDPAFDWSFVGGLTKQQKLDDSEASNTSDEVIALNKTYRNVYVDRLIISSTVNNKDIIRG